jgi:hypothetical protein
MNRIVKLDRKAAVLDGIERRTYPSCHCSIDDTDRAVLIKCRNTIQCSNLTPVEAVLCRLVDENLDRHDAIHAIASILVNHMHELMYGEDSALDSDDYYAELEKLTAEKWLRGDYTEG